MKYMGSKARHAKEILPIILADRAPGQWYVEPFVGGANVIDKVDGNRIGADYNPYVAVLWQAVSSGWVPPDVVTEGEYRDARRDRLIDARTAFIGFGCSYSGKFFGGYARGDDAKGVARNYCAESKRNILKQAESLRGVQFHHSSYDQLPIPPNSIIYCDPPYQGTTGYATGAFDHDKFWQWCRDRVADGHKVFVSEYTAPDDFVCVWSRKVNNTLVKDTGSKKGVEKLFVMRGCEPATRQPDMFIAAPEPVYKQEGLF